MKTFIKVLKAIGASLLILLAAACVVFNVLVWTEVIEVNTSQSFIGLINTCLIFGAYILMGINFFVKTVKKPKSIKVKQDKENKIVYNGKNVISYDLSFGPKTVEITYEGGKKDWVDKKEFTELLKK